MNKHLLKLALVFFILSGWLENIKVIGENTDEIQTNSYITIKKIKIVGTTVLPPSLLEDELKKIRDQPLEIDELQARLFELIETINQWYDQQGYLASGAYLPIQDLSDGSVEIQILEGQLTQIDLKNCDRLCDYIENRLNTGRSIPLKTGNLEESLARLQKDPLIKDLKASLKLGEAPNERILEVEIDEAPSWQIYTAFNNYESSSVGEFQFVGTLATSNLSGRGDRLAFNSNLTEGLLKLSAEYSIPLNPKNRSLGIFYEYGRSHIVTEPLDELDLESQIQRIGVTWREPLIQKLNEEFWLTLTFDWQQSETFLLGERFSFFEELDDGINRQTSLRFGQEYLRRGEHRAFALQSEFSFGLPIFGATVQESGLDGRYFLWRGQFRYLEAFFPNLFFNFQFSAQLTNDALLPGERYLIGGIYSVRGYDYGLRVGDSGLTTRLELQYQPLQNPKKWGTITIYPFVDFGVVGSNLGEAPSPNSFWSTGVGFYWQRSPFWVRLDYAQPLSPLPEGVTERNILFETGILWRF